MNRRAFINALGMVAGGVALSVSWSAAGVTLAEQTRRDFVADFDDPAFGTPGYAEAIPYPKPLAGTALAMDDPTFNIFAV